MNPLLLLRLAESGLRDVAQIASANASVRVHAVCDHESGHYLLVAEGWQGYRRIYRILAHVALAGDDLWVLEDGTVDGIVGRLHAQGIPKERITCAWVVPPLTDGAESR